MTLHCNSTHWAWGAYHLESKFHKNSTCSNSFHVPHAPNMSANGRNGRQGHFQDPVTHQKVNIFRNIQKLAPSEIILPFHQSCIFLTTSSVNTSLILITLQPAPVCFIYKTFTVAICSSVLCMYTCCVCYACNHVVARYLYSGGPRYKSTLNKTDLAVRASFSLGTVS